ncbi:MAG: hypothetical protein AMS21_06720 [Gemmatimonas sp. SG8_38_2]|nr:MAG: hypothetical protein AMS21_06720 [Gemmatimonas sp. SG8_38_2]
MIRFWIFVHVFSMALWLGCMFTMGIWTSRARASGDLRVVAFTYAVARRLYQRVVSASAILTVVAGAVLMLMTKRPWFSPFPEHWLFQMQVIGTIVLLATLFFVLPNGNALASLAKAALETGEFSPEFTSRVRRQAIVGSLAGVALAYLVFLGALRF